MRNILFKISLILFLVGISNLYFFNWTHLLTLWRRIKVLGKDSFIDHKESMYFTNETTTHRLTNETRGAILWTQFAGGLTNQRIRLKSAIYLAATLRRPIVLPSWILSRKKFIPNWTRASWKKISITKVYDTPFLIVCLEKLGIKAFHPCLPATCLPGFNPPRLAIRAIRRGQKISLPFVVGTSNPLFLELPSRENSFRHAIDSCITWSPNVQHFGQQVIEYITKLTGNSDLSKVFGLHLRIEDDFPSYIASLYSGLKGNVTKVPRSIEKEIIHGALHCFDKHLKHVNFSKSWIYIATGVSANSSKFRNITKRFPRIITKENMTLDFIQFGKDFTGAIDSYVLEQLPFFIGFAESTFATQVAENRRRKYLPSALYTIKRAINCSKFDIWNEW